MILKIITGTPIYIWVLLTILIQRGIRATRTSTVYLLTMYILPTIFLALKYSYFFNLKVSFLALYLVAIVIGIALGIFFTYKMHIKIIKEKTSIEVPGSYQTLIIILGYFSIRYFFGALHAINPVLAASYEIYEIMIMGLFSGFMLGKAIGFTKKYFAQ